MLQINKLQNHTTIRNTMPSSNWGVQLPNHLFGCTFSDYKKIIRLQNLHSGE